MYVKGNVYRAGLMGGVERFIAIEGLHLADDTSKLLTVIDPKVEMFINRSDSKLSNLPTPILVARFESKRERHSLM